jgi:hypothetical protein
MKGNKKAWKEMKKYNMYDVLALQEFYEKIMPWDNGIIFGIYTDEDQMNVCHCGSSEFAKNGFYYTNAGKFQKFKCKNCGAESRSSQNLLSKEKKQNTHRKTVK